MSLGNGAAMNAPATIEEPQEAVSSMQSMLKLYNEDQWGNYL
jgi:hypothetical protein